MSSLCVASTIFESIICARVRSPQQKLYILIFLSTDHDTQYQLKQLVENSTAQDNWASEASPTLECSIEISCHWASEASPTLGLFN